MSKYYVPTIKEFHIGFRYETFELDEDNDFQEYWEKRRFPEPPELCTKENGKIDLVECFYQKFTDPKYCRVKYLDKEDIEELGWARHSEPGIVTTRGVPELYEILITKRRRPKRFKLSRGGALMSVNTIEIREYVTKLNSKLIFRGEIKNYNELKRLMKQIGII